MANRVFSRRHERVERIHDKQDELLSKEDFDRCSTLRATFNAVAMKSAEVHQKEMELLISIPPKTTEAALLCFLYSTRRVGERPVLSKLDADGGMKDGLGTVLFPV